MNKKLHYIIAMLAGMLLLDEGTTQPAAYPPANAAATAETKNLYAALQRLYANGKVLLGHQDDLAYGVGWSYEPGRSDVKEVTGSFPAVYGWELGNLELDSSRNLDKVPFDFMRKAIRQGYDAGAVITLSWHANNPLTGKSAWDPVSGSVSSVLPGGAKHELFLVWLDRVAAFIGSLRGPRNELIPVLFRPWHELTGSWFWWGQNLCSPQEFKQLWKLTYDRLQIHHKLNNILWAYNTAEFNSNNHFFERYPGNNMADLVSFDTYMYQTKEGDGNARFTERVSRSLNMLRQMADSLHKIPAFAETGYEAIPQADWFTRVLGPILTRYPVSYVLLWRNAGLMPESGKMHFYAPYRGHASAPDFKQFAAKTPLMNGKALKKEKIYHNILQ